MSTGIVRMGGSVTGLAGGPGETTRAEETIRKAYELRDRVSEREKFYIESH